MRALVLFAHPALEKSVANKQLAKAVADLPFVTFHDLYEIYPDGQIVVEAEQELLRSHDLIVMQYPLYWYSTPALLKEWQDVVLTYGYAYGVDGNALAGKSLLNVLTCGGSEAAYRPDGRNRFSVREFLRPIEQTSCLCQLKFLPPLVFHGSLQVTESAADAWGRTYREVLEALHRDTDWSLLTGDDMRTALPSVATHKGAEDAW